MTAESVYQIPQSQREHIGVFESIGCSNQASKDSGRDKNSTLLAEVVESINCIYYTGEIKLAKTYKSLSMPRSIAATSCCGVDVHVLILYGPLVSCLLYSNYNCVDIVMI